MLQATSLLLLSAIFVILHLNVGSSHLWDPVAGDSLAGAPPAVAALLTERRNVRRVTKCNNCAITKCHLLCKDLVTCAISEIVRVKTSKEKLDKRVRG